MRVCHSASTAERRSWLKWLLTLAWTEVNFCRVSSVDPPLEQWALDVPEAEWVLHIHHHHEADHLGGCVKQRNELAGFQERGMRRPLAVRDHHRQSLHLL